MATFCGRHIIDPTQSLRLKAITPVNLEAINSRHLVLILDQIGQSIYNQGAVASAPRA